MSNLPHLEGELRTAIEAWNPLLGDYCIEYAQMTGTGLPNRLVEANDNLNAAALAGHCIRWLDTAIPDSPPDTAPDIVFRKIQRTLGQIARISKGDLGVVYAAVPALDEAENVGKLISSLRQQGEGDSPQAIVVADNNCTDNTAKVVRRLGGNVCSAPTPGIGPARQAALDHILGLNKAAPERTIIVQTDADCELTPGYASSVVEAFDAYPDMMVGVGPSVYRVIREDGEELTLVSAHDYGTLLGTTGLRGYFEAAQRDIADYVLEPPYRYLPGPNTSYRASLFRDHPHIAYPQGREWESICISVQVQQKVPSSTGIRYVDGQKIDVSSRAITGGEEVLTQGRLESIRRQGYVGVFSGEGSLPPSETTRLVVDRIDRRLYGLKPGERVIAVVDKSDASRAEGIATRPAIHAATGAVITGKVAVIGRVE